MRASVSRRRNVKSCAWSGRSRSSASRTACTSAGEKRSAILGYRARSQSARISSARTSTGSMSQSVLSRSKQMARTALRLMARFYEGIPMSELLLTMGNKNYSSWSLRAWILLKHVGLDFAERVIPLDTKDFVRDIADVSPTSRVPVLRHGEILVWDSLAICEYACELAGQGWPRERAARAVARAACAEMRSEEHTSELQSQSNLVCRLL